MKRYIKILEKAGWMIDKLARRKIFSGQTVTRGIQKEFAEHKEDAHALVKGRIDFFNKIYGFRFEHICIKNQKTRWGSCSRKGNLNFNYRIVFLPPRLTDYIVVHELCHLEQFNHSEKFWCLVANVFPDYRALRRELRQKKIG